MDAILTVGWFECAVFVKADHLSIHRLHVTAPESGRNKNLEGFPRIETSPERAAALAPPADTMVSLPRGSAFPPSVPRSPVTARSFPLLPPTVAA